MFILTFWLIRDIIMVINKVTYKGVMEMKYSLKYYKQLSKSIFLSLTLVASMVASGLSAVYNADSEVNASANNNLGGVYPAQMQKLNLSLVYTGSEVDGTVNSTQSFAVTDKYFIAVQAHSSKENAGWIVATDYKNPSSKPAWKVKYNIGHGNGAAWNSKKNQIVVIHGTTKFFFNATNGKFVNKVTQGVSGSGIAYDAQNDRYIQTSGSGKTSGRVLDNKFNTLFTFDAGHRLVNQDVGYHNGYIYRIGWGGCNYSGNQNVDYCRKYFGNNSNVIYQFDAKGNFVKAFYIEAGFGELESLDFAADGTMYLMFNGKPDSTHYSVYKVTNFNGQKNVKKTESKKPAEIKTEVTTTKSSTDAATKSSMPATASKQTNTNAATETAKKSTNTTSTTTTKAATETAKKSTNTTTTTTTTKPVTETAKKPTSTTTTTTSTAATTVKPVEQEAKKPTSATTVATAATSTATTKPVTESAKEPEESKPVVDTTTKPATVTTTTVAATTSTSTMNTATTNTATTTTTTTPTTTGRDSNSIPDMIVNTSKDNGEIWNGEQYSDGTMVAYAADSNNVNNNTSDELASLKTQGAIINESSVFDNNIVVLVAIIVGVLALAYFIGVIIKYI